MKISSDVAIALCDFEYKTMHRTNKNYARVKIKPLKDFKRLPRKLKKRLKRGMKVEYVGYKGKLYKVKH